jgi:hypothetical protein
MDFVIRRSTWPLAALFAMAVGSAWAWFHLGPADPGPKLRFEVARGMDGFRFVEDPISPAAQATLDTTNLFNGNFIAESELPEGPQEFTTFAAQWDGSRRQSMSVVQHTPDICWVGAGWMPHDLGQPRRVDLDLHGISVPFECRVFEAPGQPQRQLVLWCTVVGGRILDEGNRWSGEDQGQSRDQQLWSARRLSLGQWFANVRARRLGSLDKQFLRISVGVGEDWEQGLRELRRVAPLWLRVTEGGGVSREGAKRRRRKFKQREHGEHRGGE